MAQQYLPSSAMGGGIGSYATQLNALGGQQGQGGAYGAGNQLL